MDPHLAPNDKLMFYKYLDKSSVYFEYGSGGSTYQASIRDNIKKIYSVESDMKWQNILKQKITKTDITFIYNEMDTRPDTWGNPGPNCTNIQQINYSNHMGKLNKADQSNIDLILIDGRFRAACCLKCFNIIKPSCLIAFDDFLNRKEYHIVLNYFDIVDKTADKRMVILRKKNNVDIPQKFIKIYELRRG
jgi:hypothetical protein